MMLLLVTPHEKLYATISFDITQVNKITQKTYPHLSKLLSQKHGEYSRADRLKQFLSAIRAFEPEDDIANYTDRDGLIWIPVPRDSKLIADNGGGGSSWGNNIRMFCVLGLATPYNPDNHGKRNVASAQHFTAAYEARKKTEQMRRYYNAHPDTHRSAQHSPTFYLIPRYGKKRLEEAERRAAILSGLSVGKWGSDAIRDAIGNEAANQAFDVKYSSIGPRAAEQRERLKMAALRRLYDDGYFYPADVLADALSASDAIKAAEAARAGAEDMFDAYDEAIDRDARTAEYHLTKTWEQYLTPCGLLRELNLKLSPPSAADREAYHLSSGKRIVTRRQ